MLKIPKLNKEHVYEPNNIWRIVSDMPEPDISQWRREWRSSFIGAQLAVPHPSAFPDYRHELMGEMRDRQIDMARVTLEELRMYDA